MPKQNEPADRLVGRNVRMFRQAKGLSLTALGDAIGVSFQQVQKYENGSYRIGASRMLAISRALDVPVARFFEGTFPDVIDSNPLSHALAKPYATEMVRAFAMIGNESTRRSLVTLVEAIAKNKDE
jgi:transcriptional regulator with XRE-family HTH domain